MVDYIGRALVAEALREWREQLQASASVSALRDLSYSQARLIDLGGAHPGGLAPFFAGRPTLLSSLIREDTARAAAEHRADLIRAAADEVRAATGVWTAALVVGTATWSEGGHAREMPLVMRPVLWDSARDADAFVTMLDDVSLNPVFVAELRNRGDADAVTALVPDSAGGTSFDPRPVWEAIRECGPLFGEDFQVRERLLLGAFDDPEQRLVGDLDDLGDALQKSDVVAAVAGDHDAITRLSVPIPAFPTGDRDPFAERGIGDLDDSQFAALDAVATGRSLFIQSGPGFDAAGMVAAIAADGAASGKCVMVVSGNPAPLHAVNARLDVLGAGDVAVEGSQDAAARARLLASITMGDVEVDDGEIRTAGERLLAARREAQARFDGLHRTHRPWDVSAFDAVQAIVRLTSTDPAPETKVRIGADAAAVVTEHGFASVARALVDRMADADEVATEDEPVTSPTVSLVPWWSSLTDNPTDGAALDEALATLLVRHIPKMRSEAALAAHETGVDEATSLTHWGDQVQLFTDLRGTLEIFSPAVFHRSLHDIVAATAPPGGREGSLARRDRRALVRRAVELLRPGRGKATLHRDLVAAHDQAMRWRGMASAGGWPVVPDDFDIFADRMEQVMRLWARLGEPVARVTGRRDVTELAWDDMTRVLSELAEGIPGTLEAARSRPLEREIEDVGLGELLADVRARDASPEQVRRDLEFAWWGAAFEGIVAADPRLTSPGALGRAVSAFLTADAEFGRLRVGPLMRAVAERRRSAIVRNPDAARDVFAALMEGATAPYRDLWRDAGAIVAALRPVVLATAEQVARIAPPMRVVDTVVITGAESLALAETIPALARARQVVVIGDAETATRSAVSVLAGLLPRVTMPLSPQPRDPRVSAVLAAMSYGRVLQALPSAGSASRLDVTVLDAVGSPAAGHAEVESTRAEVMAVLERADRAWRTVPRRSLAVVAGNEVHADRVRDALADRDPSLAEAVAVVAIGEAAGIEVDEVVLSLGFARDARGVLPRRLGALGSEWGRQALAQALVASRERLTILTALDSQHLSVVADATDDPEGIDALRDLVVRGDAAPVAPERSEPGPSDWLLTDIATRLRGEGYGVRLRYGIGADAIPMVVGGPHDRGYRVAVVTDEAHTGVSVSVRDRLRWQQSRLEALGWIVLPLWTLDVFTDPDGALDAVRAALDADIAAETAALPTISIPVKEARDRQPGPFLELDDPAAEPEAEPEPEPEDEREPEAEAEPEPDDEPEPEAEAEPEPDDEPEPEPEPEPDDEPEPEPDDEPEPTPAPKPTMGFGVPKLAHPKPAPTRVAKGTDRPLIPTRAWEDEDDGWGGRPRRSSRDDDLRSDKPPHW